MKAEVFDVPWMAMDLPFACEIHTFAERPSITPGAKRVLVICTEPRAGMVSNEWVLEHYQRFDLIVTYDRVLQHLPNVRIQAFGGAFCDERPLRKEFSYSFLFSTGTGAPHYHGYEKRRFVADNFGASNIPGRMFLSSRRLALGEDEIARIRERGLHRNYQVETIGSAKLPVFHSMFHFAIENHDDDNFFTEKLIDCFRTHTVPIYWGTRTISEVFDMNGVIFIDDIGRLPDILSSLTSADYWGRMDSICRNFEIAANYIDVVGNIRKQIMLAFPDKGDATNDGRGLSAG